LRLVAGIIVSLACFIIIIILPGTNDIRLNPPCLPKMHKMNIDVQNKEVSEGVIIYYAIYSESMKSAKHRLVF